MGVEILAQGFWGLVAPVENSIRIWMVEKESAGRERAVRRREEEMAAKATLDRWVERVLVGR